MLDERGNVKRVKRKNISTADKYGFVYFTEWYYKGVRISTTS